MRIILASKHFRLAVNNIVRGMAVVLPALLMPSCLNIETYPEEPRISFKEFRYEDTTLVFNFTDGDGNFGIPSWDTVYPFNEGSIYYFNVYMFFEEKADTGFRQVPFEKPEYLNMRIMDVPQPTGQNKTMSGTIEYKFRKVLGDIDYHMPDTFRFRFYIYDYARNKSNEVSTPPLAYPYQIVPGI